MDSFISSTGIKKEMKDAVICLAAGKSQELIIVKAKSLGYVVVAIDKDQASPGFKYADIEICQSTYDSDAIIKELELFKDEYRWVGILNRSSGPPVITAAKICKHFNIPGTPIESAKNLVNKDRLREACLKYGIPSPAYKIYSTDEREAVFCNKFPIVVKPALSLIGKSGVSIVRSKKKLKNSIDYAIDNTVNGKIIVEEFLKGPDLTFISFIRDGELYPICLLDEINMEQEDGSIVGIGYKTHSRGKNNWMLQANKISKKIMAQFKIERSSFIASFRVDSKNNLKLIEVHLDLGGDLLIEEVFPKALPFDFLEFLVHMSVGNGEFPNYFDIKPTAIYYDKGEGLLTDRNYKVFVASSYKKIEKKILEVNI